jgi:CRISPR-associated exonuclease Cas4
VVLPSLNDVLLPAVVVVIGGVIAGLALRELLARRRDDRLGSLVAIDAGSAPLLRSTRYRLSGRPDVLRRLPDGRVVPGELKSRPTPNRGPPRSHLVQVAAYCLLVEETTGTSPPFGVLRYSDGGEFRIPWDRSARDELLRLRFELDRPYDGRATPSRAKCARCPWREVCDARAPGS